MKSEIIQEQPEDTAIEYPCLMQSRTTKTIVLFLREMEGTIVKIGNHPFTIGQVFDDFDMDNFKVFKGKLVLSND